MSSKLKGLGEDLDNLRNGIEITILLLDVRSHTELAVDVERWHHP